MSHLNEESIEIEPIKAVDVIYKYSNENNDILKLSITTRKKDGELKTYWLDGWNIERLDHDNQELFGELCSANALETLVGQEVFCRVFKNEEGEIRQRFLGIVNTKYTNTIKEELIAKRDLKNALKKVEEFDEVKQECELYKKVARTIAYFFTYYRNIEELTELERSIEHFKYMHYGYNEPTGCRTIEPRIEKACEVMGNTVRLEIKSKQKYKRYKSEQSEQTSETVKLKDESIQHTMTTKRLASYLAFSFTIGLATSISLIQLI